MEEGAKFEGRGVEMESQGVDHFHVVDGEKADLTEARSFIPILINLYTKSDIMSLSSFCLNYLSLQNLKDLWYK